MFLNRSARGHSGLKIKEIFGQKQFSIQSKVGLSLFFFVQSFVSFPTVSIFFGGFFSRHVGFDNFSKKRSFLFLVCFVSWLRIFLFLFLGSKSLERTPSSLFPLLWLGIVRTFNRVIHHFSAARKKNSAAHRFRRRRRRCCRHRRRHRGRKPFSAETATGTFPELSRLKNRKRKRLH